MDNSRRDLERRAAQGDEDARERLTRISHRSGMGRHGDKVGQWCVFPGVRDHYRGRLLSVTELGAGRAILHLSPAYWLESLASTSNEISVPSKEDCPLDLYSDGLLAVTLQPEDWPQV